jgi:hypothetical protein
MPDKGFFLITDITGYTSFLTQSELDHAQHIIEELFSSQLQAIDAPLQVSNFQGDAILCYLPEQLSGNGQVLLDSARAIYRAFQDKIAQMKINPPCHCTACSTIDLLDLKMFIHYGSYLVKQLGDREELMGQDVVVAHRMMKNDVTEKTGFSSYLLTSEAAYEHMHPEIDDLANYYYSEAYEHIGNVAMRVVPLATL